MSQKKIIIILIGLAFAIRFYSFGNIPKGINRDEAALGYNAYSILKTGRDEHGKYFPLSFESFGDWKKPAYIYATIPFVAIFELTPAVVRLPSLLFGMLLLIFIKGILDLLVKKDKQLASASIFAIAFLAVNPWHFHFSKMALEPMMAASLFVGGVWFIRNNKHIPAVILFIISMYTYHSSLVFVPLWFFAYTIFERKRFRNLSGIIAIAIFLIAVGLQFSSIFFSPESVKSKGLVIFDTTADEEIQNILSKRTFTLSKIIHNKYVYVGRKFVANYSKTFSKEFLFERGGQNNSYNVPGYGNFYYIEGLLAIFGIAYLLRSKNTKQSKVILLSWILIAPFPGAITRDAVHSTREVFLMPIIPIFAGIGASWLISMSKKKKLAILVISLLLLINSSAFLKNYYTTYKVYSDQVFHGYMEDMVVDMKEKSDNGIYENLYVSFYAESPYIFYAFYNQIDPTYFHENSVYRARDFEGFRHMYSLGNIIFEPRDEFDIFYNKVDRGNNLIYSKERELIEWIKPLQVWDNLGEGEGIISWEEEQIK